MGGGGLASVVAAVLSKCLGTRCSISVAGRLKLTGARCCRQARSERETHTLTATVTLTLTPTLTLTRYLQRGLDVAVGGVLRLVRAGSEEEGEPGGATVRVAVGLCEGRG